MTHRETPCQLHELDAAERDFAAWTRRLGGCLPGTEEYAAVEHNLRRVTRILNQLRQQVSTSHVPAA
ncbi:MAG: hypothetical protein ACRDT6_16830 [Micromonosporaceae bacterium]